MLSWAYGLLFSLTVFAQQSTLFFKVDTPIVHDPVLAYDKGLYHLYSTGEGIRHYVSSDLKHWKGWKSGVVQAAPSWIYDSVPEFKHDFWAPDVIKFRGRWYLTYSCSTFGKNTSAIGLLSNSSLNSNEPWRARFGMVYSLFLLIVHCILPQESGLLQSPVAMFQIMIMGHLVMHLL